MLAVLRFWFTKDLVRLHFCAFKSRPANTDPSIRNMSKVNLASLITLHSESSFEYVFKGLCREMCLTSGQCNWVVEDTSAPILGQGRKTSVTNTSTENKPVKISYLTEQTSHHPPVSAFWVDCPEKGITARGFDQLSARFTGTSIRVTPGAHNLGIFVSLNNRDNEEYQLTHPAAHLGGLLKGSLSVTVADTCFVTCPKTKIKVILHYLEEGWLGKTQNRMVGVVYKYDPESDKRTKIKDVPEKDVLARLDGCWHEQIYYTLADSSVGSHECLLL